MAQQLSNENKGGKCETFYGPDQEVAQGNSCPVLLVSAARKTNSESRGGAEIDSTPQWRSKKNGPPS